MKIIKGLMFVMVGIFFACSSNQIYSDLDYKNDKVLILSVGETVEFKFDSQPSTGYSWKSFFAKEEFILISDSIISSKSDAAKVGQVETQAIKMRALLAGETEIEFKYIRPWDDEKPIQTMKVRVSVR